MINLIHDDCRNALKEIPDGSIKCIVSSPPYKSIDGYSDELMADVAKESARVLEDGGMAFINFARVSEDPSRPFLVYAEFLQHLDPSEVFIWVKSEPGKWGHFTPVRSKRFTTNCFEYIFAFGKGSFCLDRLSIGVPYADKSNLKRFGHKEDKQCRGNVWYIPYRTYNGPKRHPHEFPTEIPRRCIKLSGARPGDTILDPFMGSGTSGVHCLKNELKFIGIDQNGENLIQAEKRLGALKGF